MNVVKRNTIKEAESLRKCCPFRWHPDTGETGYCVGKDCAAWRYFCDDKKHDSGYCGLGGRP